MMFVAILTRRLRNGKTYEDFRKAWYHSVGFGIPCKMYSAINVFDQREIIVVGLGEIGPRDNPTRLLRTDVEERLDHPLDAIIEPKIERTFGIVVSEDDFSPAGAIELKPASVNGRETDFNEVTQGLAMVRELISRAPREKVMARRARRKKSR